MEDEKNDSCLSGADYFDCLGNLLAFYIDIINSWMDFLRKMVCTSVHMEEFVLSVVCMIQFLIAMILDSKYDKNLLRNGIVAIWYPFLYWYINAIIVICALPSMFRKRKKKAVWDSPDRGLE